MTTSTDHLRPLLQRLSLEDKVALVQGADFWTTVPIPHIGLRAMTLSDGPAGVRGPVWDERDPSLNMPSGTALAASWDTALADRYGAAAAAEARRKGVDVVLGPTINLHRSPLGGRHFECFSEDPWLSGELGAAYVAGLQRNGVAATPKHYVANDSETDRFTVDVRLDERALRELYLLPFERTVEAGTWAIMSAYNSVHAVTMTEHDLLEEPLNSEWGFDGVIISDWTAVRSLDSIPAAQDLAMPGPAPAWADLADAIRDGRLDEAHLDRKVLRLLLLAERVGALEGSEAPTPTPVDGLAFVREAEIDGAVLVKNNGELPLQSSSLAKVAVIGHNARHARTQGGGSATVLPEQVVTPIDGIRAALPGADVTYSLGAIVQEGVAEIPVERLTNPRTGEPGLVVTFRDAARTELFTEDRRSTALVWFGGDAPIEASDLLELHATYTPEESGDVLLGFATSKHGRVFVNGTLVLDGQAEIIGTDLGAAFLAPPSLTASVAVEAGVPIDLRAEFELTSVGNALDGALSVTFGIAPDDSNPDALIAEAVEAARAAEVAIVVVGTNSKVESEGYDRQNLDLPGRQDELVRAVAAANPRTVVIVNAGAPVLLPWRDDVAAVLLAWFGGQEFGRALADILFGAAEPGGRLPTSWPATLEDVPVLDVTPNDGRLEYTEGIHIGYRAWLRADRTPAYPFGFGLGYTTWSFDTIDVTDASEADAAATNAEASNSAASDGAIVRVAVTNTGDHAGKHVVQVYAERKDSTVERPARWLVGFSVVRAEAGATVVADVPLAARRFAHWDGGWQIEPGEYTLRAGSSVSDLPLTATYAMEEERELPASPSGEE